MAQLAAAHRRHSTLPYFACVLILYLLFLLIRRQSTVIDLTPASLNLIPKRCNFTSSGGVWIRSRDPVTPRYSPACKEIFKGWSCDTKFNRDDLSRWIWKPNECKDPIPRFDPIRFLNRFRDRNIGFVGDSLNRNMFVSMVCMLRNAAEGSVRKWRPVGADRGFTFEKYNLTVAYHRTNLLASYGRWSANANGGDLESLGYRQGYRVDVDVPDRTWAEAPRFHDILIFSTGHWWWAPSKFDPVKSPMLFFENGAPLLPPVPPEHGLDMTLRHVITYVNKNTNPGSIKFFRTQSPRHFEGGDWNQGGSCRRVQPLSFDEVEELFSLENNGTNVEARLVNRHLYKALRGSSFRILDITRMSEFRADAHPSTTGGKKHEDCMHWCLPGLTDTWNDLLAARLDFTMAAIGGLIPSLKSGHPNFISDADDLTFAHYSRSCPHFEAIVHNKVKYWIAKDYTLAASLIRLHFHDCAVRGCDASVLLNHRGSERRTKASTTLRGFHVVDDIKAELEKKCPKTVSCADILTAAARDATVKIGGPFWEVAYGRKDGVVSMAKEAELVPMGHENVTHLIEFFQSKGLNMLDLVVLSGAHTIGRSQCAVIQDRLYNFRGTGKPDPSIDTKYLNFLKRKCRWATEFVDFDATTPTKFDSMYYKNLQKKMGLLSTDQLLYSDSRTAPIVAALASQPMLFYQQFAVSMVNLGNAQLLTGDDEGEIRTNCNFVNP